MDFVLKIMQNSHARQIKLISELRASQESLKCILHNIHLSDSDNAGVLESSFEIKYSLARIIRGCLGFDESLAVVNGVFLLLGS